MRVRGGQLRLVGEVNGCGSCGKLDEVCGPGRLASVGAAAEELVTGFERHAIQTNRSFLCSTK